MASITVDLLLSTGTFSTDSDRAAKALEKLGKQAAAVSAGLDKQIGGLQLQAATLGLSARQATLYELALKGASDTQLKAAESALSQVEASTKLQGVYSAIGTAAKIAFTAIAAGVVGAVVAFDQLVKSAGNFQDLSDETGAAAVDIASLAVAAGQANVSIESVAVATTKLTKGLIGVDEESSKVRAGLNSLNINIADFKKLDPVSQYEAISKSLGTFADGAQKTAVAIQLFGPAGREQLKVLKALEDQGGRTNILTAQQIALADDFSDRQGKSTAILKLYAESIATQIIPAVTGLQGVLIDLAKGLLDTNTAASAFGTEKSVTAWAKDAALAIADLLDSFRNATTEIRAFVASTQLEFANLKLAGKIAVLPPIQEGEQINPDTIVKPLQAALAERNKVAADADKVFLENANKNSTKIRDALSLRFSNDERSSFAALDPRRTDVLKGTAIDSRPTLKVTNPKKTPKNTDDPTKKLLENQIKLINDAIKEQQDLLSGQQKALTVYYDQGLISTADYYAKQVKIIQDATTQQSAEYDDQIALLKKFQANTPKDKDKADAQGKINEILAKQARLQEDAGQKFVDLSEQQRLATKRLADEFNGVNAQVLELQGNLTAAAAIKFDASFFKIKETFTAEGNAAGLKAIDILRQYAIEQANINSLSQKFSLITTDLSIAEDRISIKQQTSGLGELDALSKVGDARKAAIVQLQQQIDTFDRLDIASKTPEQIQAIERLRLELEKLQATADPLAQKFNGVFEDAFSGAFAEFISGTKSATQAFRDFGKSILAELTNIASKDIAHSIFGGSGGIGGGISDLIKSTNGQQSASGGPSGLTSGAGLGDLGNTIKNAFASLFKPGSADSLVGQNQRNGEGINVAGSGFNAARDGLATQTPAQIAAATPTIDTSAITTSLTTLQTTGLDPSTAALGRFQQAIDSSTTSLQNQQAFTQPVSSGGGSGLTTGDFTRTDHDTSPVSGQQVSAQADAAASTDAFSKSSATAAVDVLQLADAAQKGGSAMQLLPGIIAAFQAIVAATSASSAGSSSSLASLFAAFGGSSGSSAGVAGNDIALAFKEGGHTGNAAPSAEVGVVHGAEYVFSAPAVASIGVPELDRMHAAAKHGEPIMVPGLSGTDGAPGAIANQTAYSEKFRSESLESKSLKEKASRIERIESRSKVVDRLREVHARGFDDGGFTGNVGVSEPAGIVHGSEFVFSAPAVRAIGVDRLDHLHDEAKAGRLPGFSDGGYVNDFRPITSGKKFRPTDGPNGRQGGRVQNNTINISPPPGMSRDSANQIGANIARQLANASARNN